MLLNEAQLRNIAEDVDKMEQEAKKLNKVARIKRESLELDSIRRLHSAAQISEKPSAISTRQAATLRAAKNACALFLKMIDPIQVAQAKPLVADLEKMARAINS
ncbi:MAG: hypothetical protein PHE17_05280 [Thiothrix sp.]|uniref:hypothetical protein n=1 Tax=Thiothrix sp. TaxID=1032 RepID=UPI00260999E7|nr:hypothetical protein [Thiothrix sp.]MDD5392414.1 hypothetical protein [Thiothrix sp.]